MVVLKTGTQDASLLGFNMWPPFLLCPQVVTRLIHLLGEKILGSLQQGTVTGVSLGAPPSGPEASPAPWLPQAGVGGAGGNPGPCWTRTGTEHWGYLWAAVPAPCRTSDTVLQAGTCLSANVFSSGSNSERVLCAMLAGTWSRSAVAGTTRTCLGLWTPLHPRGCPKPCAPLLPFPISPQPLTHPAAP